MLTGFTVGLLLAAILLILAVRFYISAVKSPRIIDDFVAVFICFVVYHLEAQTFLAIGLKVGQTSVGQVMVDTRQAWVGFLAVVIIGLIVAGKGFQDSKVFWKGLIQLLLVWLFLLPRQAGVFTASLLDSLASIGQFLLDFQRNTTLVVIWALIGMMLGAYRLYTAQGAAGGGGGGSGKPAGGGAKA